MRRFSSIKFLSVLLLIFGLGLKPSIAKEQNLSLEVNILSNPAVETRVFLSDPFKIDKIYKSMEGPFAQVLTTLIDQEEPELLWIVGYKTEVVGEDGESPVNQEFMCHNNLDINI